MQDFSRGDWSFVWSHALGQHLPGHFQLLHRAACRGAAAQHYVQVLSHHLPSVHVQGITCVGSLPVIIITTCYMELDMSWLNLNPKAL